MFVVWLLPRHVMSVGQDSGLTRHDITTGVSWELSLPQYDPDVWHCTVGRCQDGKIVGTGNVLCLILPLQCCLPFDIPRHHRSQRHNQRPRCGGRSSVPDYDGKHFVYFQPARWMKIRLSIIKRLIHIILWTAENILGMLTVNRLTGLAVLKARPVFKLPVWLTVP